MDARSYGRRLQVSKRKPWPLIVGVTWDGSQGERAGAGGLRLRLNVRLPHSCNTSEPFRTSSPQNACNASRRELQMELVIRAREEVC